MHAKSKAMLSESGYHHGMCEWCDYPELKYHGDTEHGITQIDCAECGARYQRMLRPAAIAWASESLAAAVKSGMTELAIRRMAQLETIWAYGTGVRSSGFVWMITHTGSGSNDDDECPF